MLFSYQWLNEYVKIPVSPEKLGERLTLLGFELESIEKRGEELSNVITVQIKTVEPHPNADRLRIMQAWDGEKEHQVVTAAKNVQQDDIVPLALPGATLANDIKIKVSALRGVESFGMFCSEVELGLSDEAPGVWVLPKDTPLGVDFIDYAQLKDSIIDLDILPNRGDCQSMIGLAREIATAYKLPLTLPKTLDASTITGDTNIKVSVENTEDCPLYTVRGIRCKDALPATPIWMRQRLQSIGMNSKDLAVDISNYVLAEYGQPLHTFDWDKIQSDTVQACRAKNNTSIQSLDDESRDLSADEIIIADGSGQPLAIAGVMGGANTAVTESSQTILLEAAIFDPVSIRRAGKRLGIRSDSVIRFEKGVDPNGVIAASERAAYLFQDLAGAQVEAIVASNEVPSTEQSIPWDASKIQKRLGIELPESEMIDILKQLGIDVAGASAQIPSWRQRDLRQWEDLSEEIARLYGYDRIPASRNFPFHCQDAARDIDTLATQTHAFWSSQGFQEQISFPLVSEELISQFGLNQADALHLQNPLSPEIAVMRPSIIPSLWKTALHNQQRQQRNIRVYEWGKAFAEDGEHKVLGALFCGEYFKNPQHSHESALGMDLFAAKSLVTAYLSSLAYTQISFRSPANPVPYYDETQTLAIYSDDTPVGVLGMLNPTLISDLSMSVPVLGVEIVIDSLLDAPAPQKRYKPFSKYPSTRRDLALTVPDSVSYAEIETIIRSNTPEHCVDFFPFDVYSDLEEGKSIAIAFIYQDSGGTLSDKVVNAEQQALTKTLSSKVPVTVR